LYTKVSPYDIASRKNCRIWGKAEILNSGELFNKVAGEFASRDVKVRNVVRVAVEEVETS